MGTAEALHPDTMAADDLAMLARSALFLGYKYIESTVFRVMSTIKDVPQLKQILENWARTTMLEFYRSAFAEVDDTRAVESEFLPLLQIALQESKPAPSVKGFVNREGKIVFKHATAAREAARRFVFEAARSSKGEKI